MNNTHHNRLPVIEAEIRAAHEACIISARTSLEHAIKCGTLLLEAKDILKHGQWLPWLNANGVPERNAQRYMRLARNQAAIEANPTPMADLGIAAADRMLAASGRLDMDLSHGAIGVDAVNAVFVRVEPCGGPSRQTGEPVYVGWCHIIVTHTTPDGEGTVRRTVEAVHESEIVAWLRQHGGVDVDALTWHGGAWEPKPDTYLADQFRGLEP